MLFPKKDPIFLIFHRENKKNRASDFFPRRSTDLLVQGLIFIKKWVGCGLLGVKNIFDFWEVL